MRRAIAPPAMLLGWMSAAVAMSASLPGFESLRRDYRSSDILVLDRSGAPLQRVRADFQGRRGDWLALHEVSPALLQAVIQSEDRRFYSHHGLDVVAVAAAVWDGLTGARRRGASTLTMQLTGLIDGRHPRPAHGRSVL